MKTDKKILPYFPLNITLLPGDDIPLRIFEPRYKQLISECDEKGNTFGIPFLKNSQIQEYGSEARLKQIVATNSHGEMVVIVEGVSVFKVLSIEDPMSNKLFSGGKVQLLQSDQFIKNEELLRLLIYYTDYVDPNFLKNIDPSGIYVHDVARSLNLSSADKFNYIITKDLSQQEKFLLSQMKCLMMLRDQEKMLDNDYSLN